MKVKQEIIEATYSIEDLTKRDYELIKDGLRAIMHEDHIRGHELTAKGKIASYMLEKME